MAGGGGSSAACRASCRRTKRGEEKERLTLPGAIAHRLERDDWRSQRPGAFRNVEICSQILRLRPAATVKPRVVSTPLLAASCLPSALPPRRAGGQSQRPAQRPVKAARGRGLQGTPRGRACRWPRCPQPRCSFARGARLVKRFPRVGSLKEKKKKKNLQCNLCSNLRTPFSDFNCVTVFWYFQYPVVG